MSVELVAGDTGSVLAVICQNNQDQVAINLTGATVRLKWTIDAGNLQTRTMAVTDPAKGAAQYQFVTGDLVAGKMRAEVEITDGSGKVLTQLVPFNFDIRAKV